MYVFLGLKVLVALPIESFDKSLHISIYYRCENIQILAGTSLPVNNDYLIPVPMIKGKDADSYSNHKPKSIVLGIVKGQVRFQV